MIAGIPKVTKHKGDIMKIILMGFFGLLQLLSVAAAQNINVNGVVVDQHQAPIPYVNIGIEHKNIGTVSQPDGHFEITIPTENQTDSLLFSSIGYYPQRVAIRSLVEGNETITLKERSYDLEKIDVEAKRVKTKKIGKKRKGLLKIVAYIEDDNLGFEFVRFFENDIENIKVENFAIYVINNPFDSVKFRVNVYEVENGAPSKNILRENIFVTYQDKEGWLNVDLSEYEIYPKGNFFIGVEWIEDKSHPEDRKLYFAGKVIGPKNTWKKEISQGEWKKNTKIDVVMNATISY